MKVYSIFHRVTSVLCTLALLLGMCAVPVAAADTLRVTAATGTPIKQGSTGECSVYIDSMESLASLSVTVHFDPARVKITDLYNSVPKAYRKNAVFLMNVVTLNELCATVIANTLLEYLYTSFKV